MDIGSSKEVKNIISEGSELTASGMGIKILRIETPSKKKKREAGHFKFVAESRMGKGSGPVASYEVGYIEVRKEHKKVFDRHQMPGHMIYPSNEDFGKLAWCFAPKDYEKALKVFEEL